MTSKSLILFKLIFSLALLVMVFIPKTSSAQCGIALKDEVMKEIGKATYLKDFRVKLEENKPEKQAKQEFSILLNKGTKYRFNIKSDSVCTDQVVLKLYDFTHFYGSSYDEADGTAYTSFEFFCAKTQVYYLSISFAAGKAGCAAAIVSYVENYDAK